MVSAAGVATAAVGAIVGCASGSEVGWSAGAASVGASLGAAASGDEGARAIGAARMINMGNMRKLRIYGDSSLVVQDASEYTETVPPKRNADNDPQASPTSLTPCEVHPNASRRLLDVGISRKHQLLGISR